MSRCKIFIGLVAAFCLLAAVSAQAITSTIGADAAGADISMIQDLGANATEIGDGLSQWCSFSNLTTHIVSSVIVYYNVAFESGGAGNVNVAVGQNFSGGGGTVWTNITITPGADADGLPPFPERSWNVSAVVDTPAELTNLELRISNNSGSGYKLLWDYVKVVVQYDFYPNYGPGGITAPRGPHPITGSLWATGQTYQLIFLTRSLHDLGSGRENMGYFNDLVKSVANASTNTGVSNLTWYALGSTMEIDAKDNALVSYPVYMMDGTSMIASNYTDFWDTVLPMQINIDENNLIVTTPGWQQRFVWMGTMNGGFADIAWDTSRTLNSVGTDTSARRFDVLDNWLGNRTPYHYTNNWRFWAVSQPIVITNGVADTAAPVPDPMTFGLVPTALTTNSIEMRATLAYDLESPPVEYLFTNDTLATSSGWQFGSYWTETVPIYDVNAYRVRCRDAKGNMTAWSSSFLATPILNGPNGLVAPTGPHPTGGIWQAGMSYHLFFTSSSEHSLSDGMLPIEHWNDVVNTIADGSSLPGVPQLTWYVLGSTRAVDAKDNAVVSAAVYLMDGVTLFATNNADFWDQYVPVRSDGVTCNVTEDNEVILSDSLYGRVWTGTIRPGVKQAGYELDSVGDTTKTSRWGGGSGSANWLDNDGTHLETIARRFFVLSQEIIIGTNGMVDLDPPSPDPMSFSINPVGISTNEIHMRATPASDLLSPPVEYMFTNQTTGGSSGWQEGRYWTNTVGLFSSNSYMVKARDSVSNETAWSDALTAYPLLTGPGGVVAPTGINPGTGVIWAPGDIYQLIFLTRGKTNLGDGRENINYFNDHVNSVAADSIVTGASNLTWYALGSTTEIDAKDNALVSYPVYMMDGTSMIASNYTDFWDTVLPMQINIDENNLIVTEPGLQFVWMGTYNGGVADTGTELDAEGSNTSARRFDLTTAWLSNITDYHYTNNWRFWAVSQPMRIPTNGLVDTTPPTPSPMTWAIEPRPHTFDSVTMRATAAYDLDSPPVEYFFSNSVTHETSGWQPGLDYTPVISRGSLNTFYVKARDAAGNETGWSAGVDCTPLLQGNNGIMAPSGAHPTNGAVWQIGDQYHIIFTTSGKEDLNNGIRDISYFDGRVNFYADASTNTGFPQANWVCLGSTKTTNANQHVQIVAPVYLTDMTMFASNNADFWDATIPAAVDLDESSRRLTDNLYGRVWTGTRRPGVANGTLVLDSGIATNTSTSRWGAGVNNWLDNDGSYAYTNLRPFFAVSEVLTIQVPPDPSSITNLAVSSVTDTAATFNAHLRTPLTNQNVYVHWGAADGMQSYSWDNMDYVGSWTNVTLKTVSFTTNNLTPGALYYYTFRCTNDSTNFWATPSESFYTPQSFVAVTNLGGATNIAIGSVTLMGKIVEGGRGNAYFCWGDNDGGVSSTGAWDNVVEVGTVQEDVAFSYILDGIYWGIDYFYRVYVSNDVGLAWSTLDEFAPLIPNESRIPAANLNVTCSGHYKGHDNAFDGSGLTEDTHHDNNIDNMWLTDGGPITSQWVKVDLGATYSIGHLRVWNYNDAAYARYDRGIRTGDVFVAASDPGNNSEGVENFVTNGWTMVLTNQLFAAANGSPSLLNTDARISMHGASGSCLAIRVNANHGSALYVGLSEMQIYYSRPEGAFTIFNTGATNIVPGAASLTGVLDAPHAYFAVNVYYSPNSNDNAAAWLSDGSATSAFVGHYYGAREMSVTGNVSGLVSSNDYYYTMMISNAYTNVWAYPCLRFQSAPAAEASMYILF